MSYIKSDDDDIIDDGEFSNEFDDVPISDVEVDEDEMFQENE